MPNQINKEKQRIHLVLDKKLIAQLDAEALRLDLNRTDVIVRACREHLKLDPIAASASQIDEIRIALVQLVQEQKFNHQQLVEKIEPVLTLESGSQTSKQQEKSRWARLVRAWKE